MNLSAVILAGGESRRMGRDKAWVETEGQSLLARALARVRELEIDNLYVSGRAGTDYSSVRCPVLLDLEPGFGPLAGIERALQAAHNPLVLVLAVDLPNMTSAFLEKLAARCDPLTGAVPKLNGELEPLAAIYPKRCHAIALDFILKFRRAARDFAEVCLREHAIRVLSVCRADAPCFANWNLPSDLPAMPGKTPGV